MDKSPRDQTRDQRKAARDRYLANANRPVKLATVNPRLAFLVHRLWADLVPAKLDRCVILQAYYDAVHEGFPCIRLEVRARISGGDGPASDRIYKVETMLAVMEVERARDPSILIHHDLEMMWLKLKAATWGAGYHVRATCDQ
jgi:hypothetical protein